MVPVIIDASNVRSCRLILILNQTAALSTLNFTVQLISVSGFHQVISRTTSTVIIGSELVYVACIMAHEVILIIIIIFD